MAVKSQSAKQNAKEAVKYAHLKLKSEFAAKSDVDDLDDENSYAHFRTDEMKQNPLTAIFLALRNEKWNEFTFTMKVIWIWSAIAASGVQWVTSLMLFIYFQRLAGIDIHIPQLSQDNATRVFSAMMSCGILFVYVLGEARVSILTLKHYWAILECGFFKYWLFSMFVGDILLHIAVPILSVIAIGGQDNISDQLQISLAFFFILEFDEWFYTAFLQDYDVFNEDDFKLKCMDSIQSDQKEFWMKKNKSAIIWSTLLNLGLVYVVVYYFVIS